MRRTVLALVALCFAALPMRAAPVPPPPKELTVEMVVGEWDYCYGRVDPPWEKTGTLYVKPDGWWVTLGETRNFFWLGNRWGHGTWAIKDGTRLVLTVYDPLNWWSGIYDSYFDFAPKDRWAVGTEGDPHAHIMRKSVDR